MELGSFVCSLQWRAGRTEGVGEEMVGDGTRKEVERCGGEGTTLRACRFFGVCRRDWTMVRNGWAALMSWLDSKR